MLSEHFETIKKEFVSALSDITDFHDFPKQKQESVAEEILEAVFEHTRTYLTQYEKESLFQKLLTEVVWGFRGLQTLIDDPLIEEIMVNGYEAVYIKHRDRDAFEKTDILIESSSEMQKIIEKLLEDSGRRVDRSQPLVDVRLKNGSRVNIIVEPLAVQGPAITIRKFPQDFLTLDTLIEYQALTAEMKTLLEKAVQHKANILISGGTATGKTTVLSALSHSIPGGEHGERLIIIEETAEIKLSPSLLNVVRLETRPPNVEEKGAFTIQDLLKNALRMRPDRIVVGEVRSGEAFDMLQAMNTGHPGSLTTIHANSTSDALNRLEALVLLAGFQELPLSVIRKWIHSAVHVVIQLKRYPEGRRISEIAWVHNDMCTPLFMYKDKKWHAQKISIKKFLNFIETQQ